MKTRKKEKGKRKKSPPPFILYPLSFFTHHASCFYWWRFENRKRAITEKVVLSGDAKDVVTREKDSIGG